MKHSNDQVTFGNPCNKEIDKQIKNNNNNNNNKEKHLFSLRQLKLSSKLYISFALSFNFKLTKKKKERRKRRRKNKLQVQTAVLCIHVPISNSNWFHWKQSSSKPTDKCAIGYSSTVQTGRVVSTHGSVYLKQNKRKEN